MRSLDDIALSTGTDKSSAGHGYTRVYAQLFDPIRFGVRSVLEIGIDKGQSLRMWREYFPHAEIVGVDISEESCGTVADQPRIHAACGDIQSPGLVHALSLRGGFDLIIDDGSHKADEQQKAFENLFPLLRQGGLYCIEDIHPMWFGSDFLQYLVNRVEEMNLWDQEHGLPANANYTTKNIVSIEFHRFLAVVHKGDNANTLR